MLEALRLISAFAWLVPAVVLFPSVWRLFRGHASELDYVWAVLWFHALLDLGFVWRWLVAPESMSVWAGLYALSVLCVIGVLGVRFHHGRE